MAKVTTEYSKAEIEVLILQALGKDRGKVVFNLRMDYGYYDQDKVGAPMLDSVTVTDI